MKLLHFCRKKYRIRFFKNIRREILSYLDERNYIFFHSKDQFFNTLEARLQNYDMVFISAHGSDDSIIIPKAHRDGSFEHYILASDTHRFENNFIFAFSCNTINGFGQSAITNGALSYLGYDMEIGSLFHIHNRILPNTFKNPFQILVKRIYVEELAFCINTFLRDSLTVRELKQLFSFRVDQRIVSLGNSTSDDVFERYNIRFDKSKYNLYMPITQMIILESIQETQRHFKILGDENYISSYGIETYNYNSGNIEDFINYIRPKIASIQCEEYQNALSNMLDSQCQFN